MRTNKFITTFVGMRKKYGSFIHVLIIFICVEYTYRYIMYIRTLHAYRDFAHK